MHIKRWEWTFQICVRSCPKQNNWVKNLFRFLFKLCMFVSHIQLVHIIVMFLGGVRIIYAKNSKVINRENFTKNGLFFFYGDSFHSPAFEFSYAEQLKATSATSRIFSLSLLTQLVLAKLCNHINSKNFCLCILTQLWLSCHFPVLSLWEIYLFELWLQLLTNKMNEKEKEKRQKGKQNAKVEF